MSSWGHNLSQFPPSKKKEGPIIPMKRDMGSLRKNSPSRGTPLRMGDPRDADTSLSPDSFYPTNKKVPSLGSRHVKSVSTTFTNVPFKGHFNTTKPSTSNILTNRSNNNRTYGKKKSAAEIKAIESRKLAESKNRRIIRNSGDLVVHSEEIGSSDDAEVSPPKKQTKKFPVPDFDDPFESTMTASKRRVPTTKSKNRSEDENEPSDLIKQTRTLGSNIEFEEMMKNAAKMAQKLPDEASISTARDKYKSAPRSQSPPRRSDNNEKTSDTYTAASKRQKTVIKKTQEPTRRSPRKHKSAGDITSLLSSSSKSKGKRAGAVDAISDLDNDDDELDAIFNTEGSATLAAKKRLEELKQAGKNKKSKKILDTDEKDIWSASYKAGRKMSKLSKQLKAGDEEDDFMKTIKSTNVWIPGSQTDELLDVDLDADLSVMIKNDYEEVDEKINEIKQTRLVRAKYKDEEYNGCLTRGELERKANQHLGCIPQILKGTITSIYYTKAKEFMEYSRSTTISNSDYNRDEFSQFSIGFYGIKRQSAIAMLIRRKYSTEIQETSHFNKTIQFWSIDPFILYVLASEVAMRIAAEDLSMEEDEVVKLFQKTVDYGKYITDPIPI